MVKLFVYYGRISKTTYCVLTQKRQKIIIIIIIGK